MGLKVADKKENLLPVMRFETTDEKKLLPVA
jgi:hypothetical protein